MATMRPTPRNEFFGLLSDAMAGGLEYMRDPQRTQQLQGLAGLLESTGIPKTTERLAYGEPLTNIGRANVPLLKPETADALMTVAPIAKTAAVMAGRTGRAVGRMAGEEINAAMMGERGGLLGAMTPQPMNVILKGKKSMSKKEVQPKIAMTSDGYKFYEQPDGTYTDGDVTFESLDELFSTDPQLTVDGKIYSPKTYFEEEAKGSPINPLYDDLFQESNPSTSPFADLYKKGFK